MIIELVLPGEGDTIIERYEIDAGKTVKRIVVDGHRVRVAFGDEPPSSAGVRFVSREHTVLMGGLT